MDLNFSLHPAQAEIFTDPARFKVVAAGRRFGKSYLARVMLISEALQTEKNGVDLTKNINVAYIAPTFKQARQIMWQPLLNDLAPMNPTYSEIDGVIRLPNGRKIYLTGSDNYQSLRGNSWSFVVLDEYANMDPEVWTAVIRPSLADAEGGCLMIGTPAGKNHFYETFLKAQKKKVHPDWSAFTFNSYANPYIEDSEIMAAIVDMPRDIAEQEFEASFSAFGGLVFKQEWITELDEPPGPDGEIYMAVDLSGFDDKKKSHGRTLDDTAIAVVEVGPWGWYVHDIVTGRWDVRETAIRILRLAQVHRPNVIGIEKGPLKQAIGPFLVDNMKRLMVFPAIADCTHGAKNKQGRIQWALQGRLEQGRLTFKPGAYLKKFREQAADFPNPLAHDDMLDALAYIDQVAVTNYHEDQTVVDDFEFLDDVAGY